MLVFLVVSESEDLYFYVEFPHSVAKVKSQMKLLLMTIPLIFLMLSEI